MVRKRSCPAVSHYSVDFIPIGILSVSLSARCSGGTKRRNLFCERSMIKLTIWSLTVLPSSSMVRIFYRRVNITSKLSFTRPSWDNTVGWPCVLLCLSASELPWCLSLSIFSGLCVPESNEHDQSRNLIPLWTRVRND